MSYAKQTDIRTVDRAELVDINSVVIDPLLPKEERIKSFISQIGNPYCYRDGDVVVGISYADTDVSLEDHLRAYIESLY